MDKLIEIISLKDRSGKAEEGLEVRALLRAYHHHYGGEELENGEMVTAGGACLRWPGSTFLTSS